MLDLKRPQSIMERLSEIGHDITVAKAAEIFAADCVIREPVSLPYGGDHHGPQGFVNIMMALYETWQDFSWKMHDIWADEANGTMIHYSSIRGKTSKGSFAMPIVEYYKLRDGKIVELVPVYYDTKILADLVDH